MAINRRQWLSRAACGFGAVALRTMLHRDFGLSQAQGAHLSAPHFEPRVRSVIFLYMDGGPSQIDTFDPKPLLAKYDGKPFPTKMEPTQFNNVGNTLASPWKFQKYGESGIEVSELFPHVAKHVDSLAVIRSMVSEFSEHTNANYFLHTGSGLQGRPSMGAWTTYGLGSENENLPGYVVLNGGLIPPGGLDNFNSGFLPAAYQGSILGASDPPLANIRSLDKSPEAQVSKFQLMRQLDQANLAKHGLDDQIESAISNYELAFRMQTAIPELMEVRDETPATLAAYGLNHDFANTKTFGRQCLIARRLVERGVRFIELTCPDSQKDRWDQHSDLKEGHTRNALAVDQPIAALLADLKQRGLFDSTLVVWGGEFGRTPFAQGANGRDHNPFGFSIWMAGGGVRGGQIYGSTDDFGYKAIENKVEIHDLHATMLHLLGVHHERLTFRFGGRDMRLTDVHGHILHDILA
ncbi:MAG: DUF1501 domain-containing protein [Pirellulaceae bacterium]